MAAGNVDGGMTAVQELSSDHQEHLNLLSSMSDDDESRQLAHLAAYESVVLLLFYECYLFIITCYLCCLQCFDAVG